MIIDKKNYRFFPSLVNCCPLNAFFRAGTTGSHMEQVLDYRWMLFNFDVVFFQEFCSTTCLMGRCVILMEDPISDQLRTFSADVH